ncbi:transposase [Nonomuraea sp. NPDC050556]|uniref:transposase n=1 Tax=Nonomuraea sp. NPDC050556 TaxID=3364369 RepID=UPI0037B8A79A
MFPRADCRACPDREACTGDANGKGRHLTLLPQPLQEIQTRNRADQNTEEWKARYAIRAGCEATVSETTRAHGLRTCRYKGLAKTHVQHVLTAAGSPPDLPAPSTDSAETCPYQPSKDHQQHPESEPEPNNLTLNIFGLRHRQRHSPTLTSMIIHFGEKQDILCGPGGAQFTGAERLVSRTTSSHDRPGGASSRRSPASSSRRTGETLRSIAATSRAPREMRCNAAKIAKTDFRGLTGEAGSASRSAFLGPLRRAIESSPEPCPPR